MHETNPHEIVSSLFDQVGDAWKNGDGAAFAALCTEDCDFINLLGMYSHGRPTIAELHRRIFAGPYAGSTVTFTPERAEWLADGIILTQAPNEVQVPSGPVQGVVRCIATVVVARDGTSWRMRSFHNTRREATQAQHSAIMLDAVTRGDR